MATMAPRTDRLNTKAVAITAQIPAVRNINRRARRVRTKGFFIAANARHSSKAMAKAAPPMPAGIKGAAVAKTPSIPSKIVAMVNLKSINEREGQACKKRL